MMMPKTDQANASDSAKLNRGGPPLDAGRRRRFHGRRGRRARHVQSSNGPGRGRSASHRPGPTA